MTQPIYLPTVDEAVNAIEAAARQYAGATGHRLRFGLKVMRLRARQLLEARAAEDAGREAKASG